MRGPSTTAPGFTLIELLLAIGISALVATLAYAGVSSALSASAGIQAEVRRLAELQRALNVIEEDLAQVLPRGSVNGFGGDDAVFRGGRYQDVLLEFTRGGLANPLDLPRSELQRVRYVFADGRLWRQAWTTLDRANSTMEPQSALLLDAVDEVQLAFLAPAAAGSTPVDYQSLAASASLWDSDWNSARLAPDRVAPLPLAVDLRLRLADFGEVRRVVELP